MKGVAVSKHRASRFFGKRGVFRFTTPQGAIYLPLKPDLLALVAALHTQPVPALPGVRGPRRNILVLAR